MGHKCSIGSLSCGDTTNPSDSKYQMANLFCAAPDMLDIIKMIEADDNCYMPVHIAQMIGCAIRDAEAIPEDVD